MIETPIEIGGAVVFWSLAEWTDRARLLSGLEPLALERFVPEPRAATAALRDALEEVLGGPRILIRPLAKRDGFAVVHEERGESGNHYVQELVARVEDAGGKTLMQFHPWEDERLAAVQEAFQRQRGLLHGAQLSAMLVALIESLGGTRLRPGGALYWLPGAQVERWQAIAHAVEGAAHGNASAVYLLRHRLDADAVRAIHDAIVSEVQTQATLLHQEVLTGELGERALDHRRQQAGELRSKVRLYEELLDVGLAGLHEAVDRADQAAAAALLLASAQETRSVAQAS